MKNLETWQRAKRDAYKVNGQLEYNDLASIFIGALSYYVPKRAWDKALKSFVKQINEYHKGE